VGRRRALGGLRSDSGRRERRDQRQRAGNAGERRPDIKRLLGVEGDLGAKLGLPNDFMVQVIEQVGNYGEIWDRNLGPDTPFNWRAASTPSGPKAAALRAAVPVETGGVMG
jgi:hypothetical protein